MMLNLECLNKSNSASTYQNKNKIIIKVIKVIRIIIKVTTINKTSVSF